MLWKRWLLSNKEEGFSLLEVLLAIFLLGAVVASFFFFLRNFSAYQLKSQLSFEEEASELVASLAVLDLLRYGSSPLAHTQGTRLKVWMGRNPLEIYALQDALLIKNRGVANPVATLEGLRLSFRILPSEEGQFVEFTLDFQGSNGHHLRTLCGEVIGEKIYR
ncbi:prepilin-type N-terminal cleavage/methylation domain-containing protein [Thermatribacter velox]|uniref:Prepilin-type N-terminal cleavage/methylation domain-containing protein n=1 Tax=Thermatribacter velox TaxID=3039681 RepID=A0ABZ2YC64_9BACT